MNGSIQKVVRFLQSRHGTTIVQFAMLILLVAVALLSAITLLGHQTGHGTEHRPASIEGGVVPE
ncbi:MAG: hypothetical protein JXB62_04450 [Pirellulales bacterium]|nr:hypothetical protein [Pirellulales bacterium]